MKLKHVKIDVEKTFGGLVFAGEGEVTYEGNGRMRKPVTRTYRLYSERQRADNVEVVLPALAGEKTFAYEEAVKLKNPYLEVQGKSIGRNQAYADYVLYAEDIERA